MTEIVEWIVQTVGDLGYIGFFVMMFLESSFFPISGTSLYQIGHSS